MNTIASKLLRSSENGNFAGFEEEIRSLPVISNEKKHLSPLNTGGTASLSAFVIRAALQLSKGAKSQIAVIRTSEGSYASEWTKESGEKVIASLARNGEIRCSVVSASGAYLPAGSVGGKSDRFDTSSMIAMYLYLLMDNPEKNPALTEVSEMVKEDLEALGGNTPDLDSLYRLSDAVTEYFNGTHCKCIIKAGGFPLIGSDTVRAKGFIGELLCGTSELLMPGTRSSGPGCIYKEAKKLYTKEASENRQRFQGSVYEGLIPSFPDDYLVPGEVITICDWYTESNEDEEPARNFMIRGITGIGKSKDVELMASLLSLPLFRITCSSTMLPEAFNSTMVPLTQEEIEEREKQRILREFSLPLAADLWMDPEGAYEMMTGTFKAGVTPDEALKAYSDLIIERERARMKEESVGKFRRVDSEYLKALRVGGLIEVQEPSRILDSGVLVSLNEHDHPGAKIPLVDGSYIYRHPKAMSVWTDNLGYGTCGTMDASVLRRMVCIIDLATIVRENVVQRAMYRTHNAFDQAVVEGLFDAWNAVRLSCKKQGLDDADLSPSDLENLMLRLQKTGMGQLHQLFRWTILSKTTQDQDEQENLYQSVALPKLDEVMKIA